MARRERQMMNIFRRTGRVSLTTADGAVVSGRGIVTALRQNTGEPGGKRHELGTLGRPLYRFLGWLPCGANAVGGEITQGGRRYGVLDRRDVVLGENTIAVRMLLERRDDDENNGVVE